MVAIAVMEIKNQTKHSAQPLIHIILNVQSRTNKKGFEFSCTLPFLVPYRS